jgi:hypothetical protein
MLKPLFNLSPTIFMVFNFLSFQSSWLIAINMQQQGLLILMFILFAHFLVSKQRVRDWYTLVFITLVGSLVDLMASYSGLFIFKGDVALPLWLVLLWANFALTFQYSMAWLMRCSIIIQALLGGVFGCFSYYAAYKLGAVNYPFGIVTTIFVLVVIWTITLPVYVLIATTLQGKYDDSKKLLTSNN